MYVLQNVEGKKVVVEVTYSVKVRDRGKQGLCHCSDKRYSDGEPRFQFRKGSMKTEERTGTVLTA